MLPDQVGRDRGGKIGEEKKGVRRLTRELTNAEIEASCSTHPSKQKLRGGGRGKIRRKAEEKIKSSFEKKKAQSHCRENNRMSSSHAPRRYFN